MKNRTCVGLGIFAGIFLFFGQDSIARPQSPSRVPAAVQKGKTMTSRAKGTFEVKVTPQDDKSEDQNLGRMTIDKQFHSDLEGTSKGQMLSFRTADKRSGGYVAIELVKGKLHGKGGTFVLQHSGTMTRGTPQLSITVVPDSGTGELIGLAGKMTIEISNGKHSYDFEYTLAGNP
jgi:hypothetical protein